MESARCELPKSQDTKKRLRSLLSEIEESRYCDEVVRTTLFEWADGKGKIYHFAQTHSVISEKGLTFSGPKMESAIVVMQKRIFEELSKTKPDYVLTEWTPGMKFEKPEIRGYLREIFDDQSYSDNIRWTIESKLFRTFLVKNRQELRDKMFFIFGGAVIYGALNPQTLTESAEEKDTHSEMMRFFRIHAPDAFWVIRLTDEEYETLKKISFARERVALAKARGFLRENPDKSVAISFGTSHDFTEAYGYVFGSEGPAFERVSFPRSNVRESVIQETEKTRQARKAYLVP